MTGLLAIRVGRGEQGSPFEQGVLAARDALDQAGPLPPAFAVVVGRGRDGAAEILRGVRTALGACPLLGCVSDSPDLAPLHELERGVRVLLVASPHVRAKVGVGAEPGASWEEQADEAFRGSYINPPTPYVPEASTERTLYEWYLYRPPTLALAAVASRPGGGGRRKQQVVDLLHRRLGGRVPLVVFTHSPVGQDPGLLADDRVVTGGIVLAMVKTDLQHSIERFHDFEPLGAKLFVTRAEGDRLVEFNRRPALEAYLEALGIDRASIRDAEDGKRLFSLHPLAYRGRDGRYHLVLPEALGDDGSLVLSVRPDQEHAHYPMRAVTSAEPGGPRPLRGDGGDPVPLSGAVVLRNSELRDTSAVSARLPESGSALEAVVEVACGRNVEARLSRSDWEGETGHILFALHDRLDPAALASLENERLLGEVMRLKDLNEKIIDGIGDGIALVDGNNAIQHCNETYRALTGVPAAECPRGAASRAMELQSFVTQEVVRDTGAGKAWLRTDAFPLKDETGRVVAAIEVVRDITAYKRLSQSLELEREKMEAVVRGMAEALYIVGRDYDLQFLHRGSFPLPEGSEQNTERKKCYQLLFGRETPCTWCRMPETLAVGQVERRVGQVRDDLEERFFQITFSPWRGEGGGAQSVVCLLVDISTQRRLEQQLVRSEKLNSLAILSAGMAHELNNPLGAINFNLEILKRREKDQEYQEILASIRKDVMRINRIVGNLSSFSKSGVTSYAWLRPTEIIDAALELFHAVVERGRITVRKDYQPGLPPVWGNPQDLQQVFINFVSNSIDAMPAGGEIAIAVTANPPDGALCNDPRIEVMYDRVDVDPLLRTLLDDQGWKVGFSRGVDEAIGRLREQAASPPDIVVLDCKRGGYDAANFLQAMLAEVAPDAQVLLVGGPLVPEAEIREKVPGADRVLVRPFGKEDLRAAVRSLLPLRAPSPPGVTVTFRDNGLGMPAAVQERIFDPFFTTKSERKGTGLGLSVVHKILENHGATIRVVSSPGEGTTFVVQFPQGRPLEPGARDGFKQRGEGT